MKFLVDMNLSPAWVEFLTNVGHDKVHWSTVGASDASDREVMDWAATHDRAALTADLDFGAILAATHRAEPSVVQIRSDDLSPSAIGTAVLTAIRQTHDELESGAILSVDPVRAWLRVLPFGQ
jgi:predicted nuclease of predicted toxin-antitoxin system